MPGKRKLVNMEFALRDDDTSYFTTPEELIRVYGDIWEDIPISLSVVPFAVKSYNRGNFSQFRQNGEEKDIGNNSELVSFLKTKVKENKISIMLHGYNHRYLKKGSKWIGEYAWKDKRTLREETRKGKEHLENLLGVPVKVFVPPGNAISRKGARAVIENGLNISGSLILSKFNRNLNSAFVRNYLLKLSCRIRFGKIYPYVMDYGSHKEIRAYGLVPGVSLKELEEHLKFCYGRNAPFVLATHHWEINKHPSLQRILESFLGFAQDLKGINFVSLDSIF